MSSNNRASSPATVDGSTGQGLTAIGAALVEAAKVAAPATLTPASHFGPVQLSLPDRIALSKPKRAGQAPVAGFVRVRVPFMFDGKALVSVETMVWCEKQESDDGVSYPFRAGLPRGIQCPADTEGLEFKQGFADAIDKALGEWPAWETAYDAAIAALNGKAPERAKTAAGKPLGRLVRVVAKAGTAGQTGQSA